MEPVSIGSLPYPRIDLTTPRDTGLAGRTGVSQVIRKPLGGIEAMPKNPREFTVPSNQIIRPSGINAGIAPFAFQHYAKDFHEAYKKHKGSAKFSPARLFLLSRSLELAAKGLHLGQGRSLKDLFRIRHDLTAACEPATLAKYGITLTNEEQVDLKKANKYYEGKGFEYFLFNFPGVPIERSGPQQALSGWPDLPDESVLEVLLGKLLTPRL